MLCLEWCADVPPRVYTAPLCAGSLSSVSLVSSAGRTRQAHTAGRQRARPRSAHRVAGCKAAGQQGMFSEPAQTISLVASPAVVSGRHGPGRVSSPRVTSPRHRRWSCQRGVLGRRTDAPRTGSLTRSPAITADAEQTAELSSHRSQAAAHVVVSAAVRRRRSRGRDDGGGGSSGVGGGGSDAAKTATRLGRGGTHSARLRQLARGS